MTRVEYDGARLTIYLGVLDTLGQRRPAYGRVVERAREEGLAGVSAVQVVEGCDRSGKLRIHTSLTSS